ncbi:MAG: DNA translocase FtsK [Mogibacterium sp.]|nr:DNA translocase FtsK [Mogibacterium sp.]
MAQQNSNGQKKRGPGRPPGSKNKPKEGSAQTPNPTKQEVLDEMKRRSDRDRRNLDVIWSITLFAVAVFLFFTVVMDTTGSFGMKVHDLCLGLFGAMAYVLPFLVLIFALLLFAGRLSHIGLRTTIFSLLIFINLCILNSFRFIDPYNLRYGFADIADYYILGVRGEMGGVIGMELGSILAKLFGMPGLLIISLTVLVISVFLVANSPISRFVDSYVRKAEARRMMREIEEDERQKVAQLPGGTTAAVSEEPKPSLWKSILSGISREERSEDRPAVSRTPAADIPEPFGPSGRNAEIDYTQVVPPPAERSGGQNRNTLVGKLKGFFAIDSETGETYSSEKELKTAPEKVGMNGDKPVVRSMYAENRDFEKEEADYGYPGRRSDRNKTRPKTGLGLGDPDDTGHSGSFGLDAHGGRRPEASPAAAEAVETAAAVTDAPEPKRSSPSSSKKRSSSAAKAEKETAAEDKAADEAIAAGFSASSDDSGYEFPPVSLLKRDTGSKQMMSDIQLQDKANLLEQTLNDFGVDAKVLTVTQGASVTRYEVQPATGVKVASITRLADDIALNLRAKSIRIEAPIPGKAAVGIEVENDKPSPVFIRDLIDSDEFMNAPSKIEFVVGKDISGNNVVADLHDMPHMLIAGATGSGKSVCINSIVASFLYKAKPSDLKLIMIDPKVVELGNYNGIPHMLTPVVTDARKASRALAIAVEEMDKRYELFAENNVKDLESYNELMRMNHRWADCKPQIVIIIDELADLMMAAPSEVENSICRLAQKARAAGMHLIVATQRPSVDVVTGLIKANIPSRIAFSVASQFDSRTILDMAGAEKLLGKGDMLFSPVGSTKPYRVQGPYISEKEIDKIIRFVKKEGGDPAYDDEIQKAIDSDGRRGGSEPQDELTEDAIAFIFKSKQASVSMLQRRFRIGYNRAARIIDEIEEKGIIGPSDGSRPRQLLITEDEYYGVHDDAEDAESAEADAEAAPSPVQETVPPEAAGETHEAAPPEDEGHDKNKLSNTQAMDSFNSLPESVRRMVMDADSEDSY